MNYGQRTYKQASLTVAEPTGLPEDMRQEFAEILAVRSQNPRKGHATALMHMVCTEADLAGKLLMLKVQAFDDGAMSDDQLRKWYSRFGFVEVQQEPAVLMARAPEHLKVVRA